MICLLIFFEREREKRRERERETPIGEKNINQLPPVWARTRDGTHNVFGVHSDVPTDYTTQPGAHKTFLNSQRVRQKITREVRKYL